MTDINNFQLEWKAGTTDDDLFSMYKFKPYKRVHRPYKTLPDLCGTKPKKPQLSSCYYVLRRISKSMLDICFKKENNNEPQEVELAIKRADSYWSLLERNNNEK